MRRETLDSLIAWPKRPFINYSSFYNLTSGEAKKNVLYGNYLQLDVSCLEMGH